MTVSDNIYIYMYISDNIYISCIYRMYSILYFIRIMSCVYICRYVFDISLRIDQGNSQLTIVMVMVIAIAVVLIIVIVVAISP